MSHADSVISAVNCCVVTLSDVDWNTTERSFALVSVHRLFFPWFDIFTRFCWWHWFYFVFDIECLVPSYFVHSDSSIKWLGYIHCHAWHMIVMERACLVGNKVQRLTWSCEWIRTTWGHNRPDVVASRMTANCRSLSVAPIQAEVHGNRCKWKQFIVLAHITVEKRYTSGRPTKRDQLQKWFGNMNWKEISSHRTRSSRFCRGKMVNWFERFISTLMVPSDAAFRLIKFCMIHIVSRNPEI